MKNVKIKVCGITKTEEVRWLIDEGVDYCGVVMFFPESKRNTDAKQAGDIVNMAAGRIKTVAVTVSPLVEQLKVIEQLGFDYIQVHGTLEQDVHKMAAIPIIRAINVQCGIDQLEVLKEDKICGMLYDGSKPGAGKTFDWNVMEGVNRYGKMLILAGGLNPNNVGQAIEKIGPDVVDVSSGVEYDDRLGKDPDKIKAFVRECRQLG